MLCGPASMNQRGSFSASTYYRRKQLNSCGFDMRWQERVTSNNLMSVSAVNTREVRCHSNGVEVEPRVIERGGRGKDVRNSFAPIR